MKIAVGGKGGSGKTTGAGTLARIAGVIPYDQAVVDTDEHGTAVIDQRPDATSVVAIRQLADDLLTTAA